MEDKYEQLAENLNTLYNGNLVEILKLVGYEQEIDELIEYTDMCINASVSHAEETMNTFE